MQGVLHELKDVEQLGATGGTAMLELVRNGADQAQQPRARRRRHLGDEEDVASVFWQPDFGHGQHLRRHGTASKRPRP